jgi:hypothetical protein
VLKEFGPFRDGDSAMKMREVLPFVRDACRHKNLISQVFDVIYHKMKINTSPIDYYRYQFYKDSLTLEQKARYIGKRGSCFYPWQGNKVQYTPLFDNKYVFKTMLSGFGLPQPKYITSIGQDYEIKTYEQFCDFLSKETRSIVLKPMDGSGGRGIIIVTFKDQKHFIHDEACGPRDVWQKINEGRNPYLAEESVEQIPEMSRIYPGSLNTLRIITIKSRGLEWHLVGVWMRVGQGKTQVDNIGSGGIAIGIDGTGRIYHARSWRLKEDVVIHPDTGVNLIGIEIPQYSEAVALSLEASRKFGFMGTIGWDIGLSINGPVIIEGNIFYDCYYWQYGIQGPMIPSHLASNLERRKWWQRYDKTAMHPKADRDHIRA